MYPLSDQALRANLELTHDLAVDAATVSYLLAVVTHRQAPSDRTAFLVSAAADMHSRAIDTDATAALAEAVEHATAATLTEAASLVLQGDHDSALELL